MRAVIRRRFAAWLALAALVMQAMWPLAAAANSVPSDVCTLGGAAQMPDPKSPACLLHCATCLAGPGQAVLDTPAAPPIVGDRPVFRIRLREAAAPRACGEAFDAAARAPPAFS